MPIYLNTIGRSTLAIGVCARCGVKMPRDALMSDPNSPGLFVCKDDLDKLDPYRLPAREADNIVVDNPRPDVSLTPGAYAANQIVPAIVPQIITDNYGNVLVTEAGLILVSNVTSQIILVTLQQSVPWSAKASFSQGAQVTPVNPVGTNQAGLIIYQFACLVAGTTGATAPIWTTNKGTYVVDGSVIWYNVGLYLP